MIDTDDMVTDIDDRYIHIEIDTDGVRKCPLEALLSFLFWNWWHSFHWAIASLLLSHKLYLSRSVTAGNFNPPTLPRWVPPSAVVEVGNLFISKEESASTGRTRRFWQRSNFFMWLRNPTEATVSPEMRKVNQPHCALWRSTANICRDKATAWKPPSWVI